MNLWENGPLIEEEEEGILDGWGKAGRELVAVEALYPRSTRRAYMKRQLQEDA